MVKNIHHQLIKEAKTKGFKVTLLFFWLRLIDLAKSRVATRVKEGGHHIPADTIERRYKSGINNLFAIYLQIVDDWFIYDNSNTESELIAQKNDIFNQEKWELLNKGH